MIAQLHTFREECLKQQLQSGKDQIEKYQAELGIIKKQLEQWKEALKTPQFDQEKLDELIQQTNASLIEYKQNIFDFKNKLLRGKGFYFDSFDKDKQLLSSKDFGFDYLIFDDLQRINKFQAIKFILNFCKYL